MAEPKMTDKQRRASRAKKWKRKVYEDFEFPNSDLTADIQKPRMYALITKDGNIPNKFFGDIFGDANQKKAMLEKMKPEERAEYMQTMMYLADQITIAAFVSPKIVQENANYEDDEINLSDIDDEIKDFLMNWVMGGGEPDAAIKRFLAAQQKASMDAAPTG